MLLMPIAESGRCIVEFSKNKVALLLMVLRLMLEEGMSITLLPAAAIPQKCLWTRDRNSWPFNGLQEICTSLKPLGRFNRLVLSTHFCLYEWG